MIESYDIRERIPTTCLRMRCDVCGELLYPQDYFATRYGLECDANFAGWITTITEDGVRHHYCSRECQAKAWKTTKKCP